MPSAIIIDRWTAIAFSFILGGLGVHRFYIGQWQLGLIYLIFCWTLIPSFVALIDGIIWIVQDENKFNKKYNGFKYKS